MQNTGAATATFSNTNEVLKDERPSVGVTSYGAASAVAGGGATGTVTCAATGGGVNPDLTCTASGTVTIPQNGYFDISYSVTPSAVGPLTNPRAAAVCSVDRLLAVGEFNESNNTCSETVTVVAPQPDLTALKTASVSVQAGLPFDWTVKVTNAGTASATFNSTNEILYDELPGNTGAPSVTYTWPATVGSPVGIQRHRHDQLFEWRDSSQSNSYLYGKWRHGNHRTGRQLHSCHTRHAGSDRNKNESDEPARDG